LRRREVGWEEAPRLATRRTENHTRFGDRRGGWLAKGERAEKHARWNLGDDGRADGVGRPYFGWPYGLLFAAVQAGLCWRLAIDREIVWLVRTWGITGGAPLVLCSSPGSRSD